MPRRQAPDPRAIHASLPHRLSCGRTVLHPDGHAEVHTYATRTLLDADRLDGRERGIGGRFGALDPHDFEQVRLRAHRDRTHVGVGVVAPGLADHLLRFRAAVMRLEVEAVRRAAVDRLVLGLHHDTAVLQTPRQRTYVD